MANMGHNNSTDGQSGMLEALFSMATLPYTGVVVFIGFLAGEQTKPMSRRNGA